MLEIKNLKKTFTDGTRAINDVSFKLNRGEFVVVLGPSGSGKTTLLRCINSLLVKTAGQIILCNQEIETGKQKFVQKHISMIFQDFKLVSNLSVLNNVLSGMLEECHSFASFKNASIPFEVSGWLNSFINVAGGTVTTSAPINAPSSI